MYEIMAKVFTNILKKVECKSGIESNNDFVEVRQIMIATLITNEAINLKTEELERKGDMQIGH